MSKIPRKRLCWNCEGSVSLAEEICPFCGVSVVPAFLEGTGANFAPPYSTYAETDSEIPRSPYETSIDKDQPDQEEILSNEVEEEPEYDEFKHVVISVTLLLSGSVFFLFGLALALFSHNGVFTLQWDGSFWFIYLALSLPLVLWGWKTMMKLDEF